MAVLKRFRLRDKAGTHTIHSDKGRRVLRSMKPGDTVDSTSALDEIFLEKFDCLGEVAELDKDKNPKLKKDKPGASLNKNQPIPDEPVQAGSDHNDPKELHEDNDDEEHEAVEKDVTDKFVRAADKGVKVFRREDGSYFVCDEDDDSKEPLEVFEKKTDLREWLSADKKKKKKK